ncbi:protease modulator HflC [Rubellimicrobium arenae]|uniref:protease modulator HflC n=1 Tax=Rubellimicrobium arenae TaxID=2817372 RepID=UPI001B305980|nr:protease modulator HflC [Rubellimicrobium arenae]
MRRSATAILVALGVVLVLLLSSIFVVDEREKALVLQFGQIRQVREEPGLGLKIPFIQDVVKYDDRILSLDTETIEVTPSDDRRLVVDAFTRYRIADVVRFRQAVGAGGITTAENLLNNILNAQIRAVLGSDQVTSDTILSTDRRALMNRIREGAQNEAQALGLNVVDVRLKATNLPAQNLEATFARMRAEREREAADEIARGNEAAQRIRATADRTVTETISEAERDAQITRGEADAEANRVFADAYGRDPEFFQFYRSMQAYTSALRGSNSTMVLTPNNEFFDYFYQGGRGGDAGAVPGASSAGAPEASAAPATPDATGGVTVTVDEPASEASAADEAAQPATP